jgi:hypothetical protein
MDNNISEQYDATGQGNTADQTASSGAIGAICLADSTHESASDRSADVAVSGNETVDADTGDRSGRGSDSTGVGNRFAEPRPIEIPPKLYRIGEVIECSGLSRQTVHNYTTMGLLVEVRRTDGGHRLYDESVFERLNGVIALKAQHKSLAYIREYYAKVDSG